MNSTLPDRLKAAIEALLEGVSRKELAARAQAISTQYRSGLGSDTAVTAPADVLAYVIARLPATYAVAAAVFAQLRDAAPDFLPGSLLDAGAGPGTASWAARETWPGLWQLTLVDSNRAFLGLGQRLTPSPEASFFLRDLARQDLPSADLVIANFVLAEIAPDLQDGVVQKLFAASRDVLVLIEPGTPAGFARIKAARAALIGQGAQVLGPCTHANACPVAAPDWCHFSQRLPRSRDHMQAKGASVPYEDERYSWIAVSRARRSAQAGRARVLDTPDESKPGVTLKLCTPEGLENRFVPRRDKAAFAALRRTGWGDVVIL